MKIRMKALILIGVLTLFPATAFSETIITAPIDSRPISTDYLEKLANLQGDCVILPEDKYLDLFTQDGSVEKLADSPRIRKEIEDKVKINNHEDTTVILNCSTYFSGGLVGSRAGANYQGTEEGLEDLYHLVSEYSKPSYYVNISMPRNLPETRGQKIWPDEEKIRGLSFFYLQDHPEDRNKETIRTKFSYVTPIQFLMEYSYVLNKSEELGKESLESFEKSYLSYVERVICSDKEKLSYIEQYKAPFYQTAKMFESIIRWERVGLIDEVIIGNDDLQLPESIAWFYKTESPAWIPTEHGSPIKFSFARTCSLIGEKSILGKIVSNYSEIEAELAYEAKSEHVNFLFGMDEIPQMIYARDLAKRTGMSTNLQISGLEDTGVVADYDVLAPEKLVENAQNFLSAGREKKGLPIEVFVYDYTNPPKKDAFLNQMEKAIESGKKIGLIELFAYDTAEGKNAIFLDILDGKQSFSVSDLVCYNAWNTNANTIGLGLSHAAVFGISQESGIDGQTLIQGQGSFLGMKLIEDGIYMGQVRRRLQSEGYVPKAGEEKDSYLLKQRLCIDKIIEQMSGSMYRTKEGLWKIGEFQMDRCAFPWRRVFDCEIDISCKVNRVLEN